MRAVEIEADDEDGPSSAGRRSVPPWSEATVPSVVRAFIQRNRLLKRWRLTRLSIGFPTQASDGLSSRFYLPARPVAYLRPWQSRCFLLLRQTCTRWAECMTVRSVRVSSTGSFGEPSRGTAFGVSRSIGNFESAGIVLPRKARSPCALHTRTHFGSG